MNVSDLLSLCLDFAAPQRGGRPEEVSRCCRA